MTDAELLEQRRKNGALGGAATKGKVYTRAMCTICGQIRATREADGVLLLRRHKTMDGKACAGAGRPAPASLCLPTSPLKSPQEKVTEAMAPFTQCPACPKCGHQASFRWALADPARARTLESPDRETREHHRCSCSVCGYGWNMAVKEGASNTLDVYAKGSYQVGGEAP